MWTYCIYLESHVGRLKTSPNLINWDQVPIWDDPIHCSIVVYLLHNFYLGSTTLPVTVTTGNTTFLIANSYCINPLPLTSWVVDQTCIYYSSVRMPWQSLLPWSLVEYFFCVVYTIWFIWCMYSPLVYNIHGPWAKLQANFTRNQGRAVRKLYVKHWRKAGQSVWR